MKWDEFFFQFNSIQFAVWYWGISLFCLMNFERDNHFFLSHSNQTSHDKRLFSSRLTSYFQPNTISNNNSIVDFLLSTPFHLPTIWAVNHFHLWFHHRHLKSRQMNWLFLSINYLQFISSWGWGRGRVCVRRVWEDE